MPEYIERAELMKFPIRIDHYDKEHGNVNFVYGVETVLEYAKNIPTADVAPVVHGRWVDYHFVKTDCPKDGFPTVKCSNCEIVFCDLINNHHFMYHYCPNCGARMDGE